MTEAMERAYAVDGHDVDGYPSLVLVLERLKSHSRSLVGG